MHSWKKLGGQLVRKVFSSVSYFLLLRIMAITGGLQETQNHTNDTLNASRLVDVSEHISHLFLNSFRLWQTAWEQIFLVTVVLRHSFTPLEDILEAVLQRKLCAFRL